jgi:hypothetical protein
MSISIEAKLDRLVDLCEQGEIQPPPGEPGESFKTEDWEVTTPAEGGVFRAKI